MIDDNIELVPEEGFTDGKLNAEGRAMAALNALPLHIDELDAQEQQYRSWKVGHKVISRLARPLTEFLREEIAILARKLADEIFAKRSQDITGDFYRDYLRIVEEARETRRFLKEHFESDIAAAEATNRPLSEVVREIMLRAKR